jgi:hypothetical protein
MDRLIPQFEKLKQGSRIVSHQFEMPGIKPDKTLIVQSKEDGDNHRIFLWTTPLRKESNSSTSPTLPISACQELGALHGAASQFTVETHANDKRVFLLFRQPAELYFSGPPLCFRDAAADGWHPDGFWC